MWKSVNIAIVGESIGCNVSDMKVVPNFRSVGEFEVCFGLVGKVSDQVRQFFGRSCGGARVHGCGVW